MRTAARWMLHLLAQLLLPAVLLAALVASALYPRDDRDLDAHPQHVGMWDIERGHPWRWAAAYGAAVVATLLLSHAAARGWL